MTEPKIEAGDEKVITTTMEAVSESVGTTKEENVDKNSEQKEIISTEKDMGVMEDGSWGATWFKKISDKTGGVGLNSWEEIKEKLTHPVKLEVTVGELLELKATDGEKHKELKLNRPGLYVGYKMLGAGRGGHPSLILGTKANPPKNISLLALDYDEAESWLIPNVETVLKGYKYIAHTTATATEEKPRWRVVVPFKNCVDPEAREALARVLADKIGWAGLDDSSTRWTQRMAFPAETTDVKFKYIEGDGEFIDVISYLDANFSTWRQPETRPFGGKNEKSALTRRKSAKRAIDSTPVEYVKKVPRGVLGAFCEVYSCDDVLEKSGAYKLLTKDENTSRWSRMRDENGGIVVYHDNETCSCFLATDRLAGEFCLNPFSLALKLLYNDDFKEALRQIKRDDKVVEKRLGDRFKNFDVFSEKWGDENEYERGWPGILKRLREAFPIKTLQYTNEKGKSVQVIFEYKNGVYNGINTHKIVNYITQICEYCTTKWAYLEEDMGKYCVSPSLASGLAREIFSIESIKTRPEDWDADPFLINCRDGVVNLRGMCVEIAKKKNFRIEKWENLPDLWCFREHKETDLFLKQANFNFNDWKDKTAQHKFQEFLDSVLPKKDKNGDNLQQYLQTAIGSSLGDCSMDNIFIWLLGRAGAGKSTLLNGIRGGLGPYYGTADISNFYTDTRVDDPTVPQPQLDALRNKKIAVFSEASADKRISCGNIKKFFSGGEVRTRTLNDVGGPWVPRFRGICDCNEFPQLNDPTDGGIRRRFRIIPWNPPLFKLDATISMSFSNDKKIQAAIFMWLLVGCARWASQDFLLDGGIENAPLAVQDATNRELNQGDAVLEFIDDNIDQTNLPQDFMSTDEIYKIFEKESNKKISYINFSKRLNTILTNRGIEEKRGKTMSGKRVRGYSGIKSAIKSDERIIRDMGANWNHLYPSERRELIEKASTMYLSPQQEWDDENTDAQIEDYMRNVPNAMRGEAEKKVLSAC